MSVVVSRREVGVCRQEFEIEVPASEVDAEYLRVARDYRRRARIDGFRKGKAPLDLVRQRFGDSIGEDVSERLAPKYWQRASEEDGVHAMLPPSVAPVQAAPGQPLRFTVTVDVEPEVEIGDSRSFELPQPETEPSEAEVDELLEQVRLQRSTWVPVERAAARGDRVRGRIHRSAMPGYAPEAAAEDDQDRDQDDRGPATHEIDLELGDERAWPELTDNLTGLSAGQRADFERTETDEDVERQRGYEIEVEEVLERKLPDVDDDWASSLAATIETVDDLRRQLGEQVQAQKTEQAGQQRTDALLDQLRERYPVTLPEAVVEREALQMARSYANNLARQGFDLERQQLPWEQLMEEIRPQAEKRAHSSFLLDRIARDDGVEATAQDLERALEIMARARNTNRGRLRRELERDGGLEMLRVELRRDRTVQTLLAANAPPEEPSAPADEPAAEGED
ncbi:MAG: trigger factor [Acidobacteria bacterium]|nr:trigger factor [Acidobacteriota bacterium]